MKKASLTTFHRVTEVHPRGGVLDNNAIARYVERHEAGEEPRPLIVQRETMIVVDGWHRIEAAQRAGLTELPFEEISIADEDIKRMAYKLNKDHGVPISKEQRNAMIAEDAERFTQEELGEFYGLTQRAIGYILENRSNRKTANTSKKDHRKKVEAADVIAAWRLNPGMTQKELAAQFDISQRRASGILSDFRASMVNTDTL